MRETVVGFSQGQYGDLFMNLTACGVLKEMWPDCNLVFSINQKYEDAIDILKLSKDIDNFIVWENYDNWPSESDKKKLQKLSERGCRFIFNPMPQHSICNWYKYRHQTEETCLMYDLPLPTAEQINFQLDHPELEKEGTITICTARRIEDSGKINGKALTNEQIEIVKNFALKSKLKLIQIGGPEEEAIEGVAKFEGNYSESVFKVLRSQFLVSVDTGMIWAASGFSHPTVGLYDLSYYNDSESCENWTPKNKNQITLFGKKMRDISLPMLEEALANKYNESLL